MTVLDEYLHELSTVSSIQRRQNGLEERCRPAARSLRAYRNRPGDEVYSEAVSEPSCSLSVQRRNTLGVRGWESEYHRFVIVRRRVLTRQVRFRAYGGAAACLSAVPSSVQRGLAHGV